MEKLIKVKSHASSMKPTIEHVHQEVMELKREVSLIKNILAEEELSEEAKDKLAKARKTPDSEYIDHEEVKKKFLI